MTIGSDIRDTTRLDAPATLAQRYLEEFSWVDPSAVEICIRMDAGSIAHKASLRRTVQSLGLESSTGYSVLRSLYFSPQHRMNQSEIGIDVQMASASITYLIDSLEKEQLVRREVGPVDRRMKSIVLTPRGEELCQILIPAIADLMNRTLAGFTEEEKSTFISLLERFRQSALATMKGEDEA